MAWRVLTVFVVVALLPAHAAARQRDPFAQLETYLQLVERYRQSGDTEVVAALVALPRPHIDDAVEMWARLVTNVRYRTLGQQREALKIAFAQRSFETAAVLHTAAGMVAYNAGDSRALESHLSFASRILALRDARPPLNFEQRQSNQLFEAGWHHLVATFLHSRLMLEVAKPYMDKALEILPDDAAIMLATARLLEASHETRSTQTVPQSSLSAYARGPTRQQSMIERLRTEQEIARAEELLRAVITRDHEPALARLRLGRVLYARGRTEEAAAELIAVLKSPHPPGTGYLAHLFLARIAEEQRDVPGALVHYQAATHLQVSNQSARIGMARLLAVSGQHDDARDLVLATLMTSRDGSDDPWWPYYYPDMNAVSVLIEQLRKRAQ
jgi:tetratricopeptide (TPR) repeat protein